MTKSKEEFKELLAAIASKQIELGLKIFEVVSQELERRRNQEEESRKLNPKYK